MLNNENAPQIVPTDWWTEYVVDPNNPKEQIGVDYVKWVKKGTNGNAATCEKVARYMAKTDAHGNVIREAALEWSVLEPYYKAWKEGEEIPEIGTPLAAWPGASVQLVEALKKYKIKTVEDFAMSVDAALGGIPIPNIGQLRRTAHAFLEAQRTTSQVEAALTAKDGIIDALKADMAEMREMMHQMQVNGGVPAAPPGTVLVAPNELPPPPAAPPGTVPQVAPADGVEFNRETPIPLG